MLFLSEEVDVCCSLYGGRGDKSKIYGHAPEEEETHLIRRMNPSGANDNIIVEEENKTNPLIIVDSDSGQLIIFLR